MAGFYALLCAGNADTPSPRFLLLVAGCATTLAFTFDLLAAPFPVFFAAVALLHYRRRAWPFALGSLLPLALLVTLDYWLLGDPLPPSMHPAGFDYPGSTFATTITGNPPATDVLDHGFQMMFGERGLFSLNPLLLWAVAGLGVLLRRRDHRLWPEAVAITLASLAVVVSLALFTPGFGGVSYGTRWLAEITPVLFFFAACPALYRPRFRRALCVVLAVFSLFSAWQGALHPWGVTLPPFRLLQYAASPVGRYLEDLPAERVLYATPTRVRYLPVFPKHAWHTRLRPFDAASGVLPAGAPDRPAVYVLSADDRAAGELLEAAFPHGQWDLITEELAAYRVPPGTDRVRPAQSLQAEFAGQIRLLGCDISPPLSGEGTGEGALRPGDTLRVRLYWQALAPMERGYTAFVHLLGPPNPSTGTPLWAQDDHQPGHTTYPTYRWFPGEVVLDWFQFVLPDNAPPGEYVLTTGFYDLTTMQRLARSDVEGDTATLSSITVMP